MQSNNNKKKSRPQPGRKRNGKKGPSEPMSLTSPEFQEKVTRLDKLMQLASAPTPKAPPGFVLMKDEKGGTLEQVGREADNAWAGVKRIMELLNVEEKYVDVTTVSNINYTGAVFDLAATITQGVGRGQRTGDSIKITRVLVKYVAVCGVAGTEMQVVLGHSKDALPSASDLFALSGATSSLAGFTHDNWYEVKANPVSRRDTMLLMPAGTGTGDHSKHYREYEHKFDHHIFFAAGTVTSLSGATWMAAISGQNASQPTLAYNIRVFFVDN